MLSASELKERLRQVDEGLYIQKTKNGGEKWKENRSYEAILYPESCNGYIQKLADNFPSACCLSPLHDRDIDNDGCIKKPHFHFIAHYSGKKNPYNFYCDVCNTFGDSCFNTIQSKSDISAAVKYLAHTFCKDKKKAKYNIDDIISYNGFDASKYLFENTGDLMENINNIMEIIDSENILFYNKLARYLQKENSSLFMALVKDRDVRSFTMNYLKGKEHDLWYAGEVEKGYQRERFLANGEKETDKYSFTRKFAG